ncbi:MAG TPA: 5-dehydro-4-deoxy-D-glucuronate isomerase, partial [Candidatus Paceibacterota bacterium]|nr:5-dehydro-4-deoxy-D-glucuronate isomerase [Candidatus Paceibacterota bacterium]
MKTNYEIRYASHPQDVKNYDTSRLRKEFLVEKIFSKDEVNMVYSLFDRIIIGG